MSTFIGLRTNKTSKSKSEEKPKTTSKSKSEEKK